MLLRTILQELNVYAMQRGDNISRECMIVRSGSESVELRIIFLDVHHLVHHLS